MWYLTMRPNQKLQARDADAMTQPASGVNRRRADNSDDERRQDIAVGSFAVGGLFGELGITANCLQGLGFLRRICSRHNH